MTTGSSAPERRPRRGVFYGWRVVAVCLLLATLSSGTAFYAFGLFIIPFHETLGWSRGAVGGAISLHFLVVALTGPLVGRLVDRYGPRYLMLGGALLGGLSYLLLSRISALPALYILWVLFAVGVSSFGVVPIGSLVSRWFVRRRGLAMGIAMTGIGLGGFILAPITGALIAALGWRATAVALGAILLIVPAPFLLLVLRNSPAEMGLLPDGDEPSAVSPSGRPGMLPSHWDLRGAVATPAFWLTGGAFFLGSTATVGVLQHQASFFQDYSVAATTAALALGATSGVGAIGKTLIGYVSDKVPVRYVAFLSFSFQAAALALLLITQQPWALAVYVIFFGIGMGATVVLVPLLVGDIFGLGPRYGILLGATSMVQGLGLALGPFAAGRIFDAFGSYALAFQVSLALYAGATVLVFLIRRPKGPALRPVAEASLVTPKG
ncbi:MAG: MFS transporter [Chloroflexi bacterium]|nr:MFS transporter [Chloroflexota bacterium]